VLTERTDHLAAIADGLGREAVNVVVLRGGMGVKQRRAAKDPSSMPGAFTAFTPTSE
jgi:hypothetical protein